MQRGRRERIFPQAHHEGVAAERQEGEHDDAPGEPNADNGEDGENPNDHEGVVEGARLFSAQQHRQRAAGGLDVLLDIAGVVRHHDEAHADDRGRGPKERHERERAREYLVACQRNKTAHNDAAHRLADGKVGERRLASGVHHDDDGSDKRDDEGDRTAFQITYRPSRKATVRKPMASPRAERGLTSL